MSNLIISMAEQGSWVIYTVLFLIIFFETGVVITPFLPGDSLLFMCGSLAAIPNSFFNIQLLIGLLAAAACLGDSVNFEIGKKFGKLFLKSKRSKWIKSSSLERAEKFFKKYGAWAIFLGRFAPIIRTLIPFSAGISKMDYHKFFFFNICGALAWVDLVTLAGYFLGKVSFIKDHFELLMILIVLVSLFPISLINFKRSSRAKNLQKLSRRSELDEKK